MNSNFNPVVVISPYSKEVWLFGDYLRMSTEDLKTLQNILREEREVTVNVSVYERGPDVPEFLSRLVKYFKEGNLNIVINYVPLREVVNVHIESNRIRGEKGELIRYAVQISVTSSIVYRKQNLTKEDLLREVIGNFYRRLESSIVEEYTSDRFLHY